jgi:hypothetical protein
VQRLALAVAAATPKLPSPRIATFPPTPAATRQPSTAAVGRADRRHRLWLGQETLSTTHQGTEADRRRDARRIALAKTVTRHAAPCAGLTAGDEPCSVLPTTAPS